MTHIDQESTVKRFLQMKVLSHLESVGPDTALYVGERSREKVDDKSGLITHCNNDTIVTSIGVNVRAYAFDLCIMLAWAELLRSWSYLRVYEKETNDIPVTR